MMRYEKAEMPAFANWNLFVEKEDILTAHMMETLNTLAEACDDGIGFCILGDGSYFVQLSEQFDEMDQVMDILHESIEDLFGYHPDFSIVDLMDGEKGAILTMSDCFWQILLPEEATYVDGSLDIRCALLARAQLMQACDKGEVLGFLLPKSSKFTP